MIHGDLFEGALGGAVAGLGSGIILAILFWLFPFLRPRLKSRGPSVGWRACFYLFAGTCAVLAFFLWEV
jgi:hypothetical protein